MLENLYAKLAESLYERIRRRLRRVVCDADTSDVQSALTESVDESQRVHVVGNSEVGTHFVLLDSRRRNNDYYLGLVLQPEKHIYLCVRLESGKYA